jgi:hypothetical protein
MSEHKKSHEFVYSYGLWHIRIHNSQISMDGLQRGEDMLLQRCEMALNHNMKQLHQFVVHLYASPMGSPSLASHTVKQLQNRFHTSISQGKFDFVPLI